jgi:hypothetical protein
LAGAPKNSARTAVWVCKRRRDARIDRIGAEKPQSVLFSLRGYSELAIRSVFRGLHQLVFFNRVPENRQYFRAGKSGYYRNGGAPGRKIIVIIKSCRWRGVHSNEMGGKEKHGKSARTIMRRRKTIYLLGGGGKKSQSPRIN